MNSKNKICSLLLLSVTLSCTDKAYEADKIINSIPTEQVFEVTHFIISDSIFDNQLVANGQINSLQKAELFFYSNDKITNIAVRNGEKVKAGQLIASIENSLLKNNLDKAKIEFEKAENKLREENINYNSEVQSPLVIKNLQIKSGILTAQNNLERANLEYQQTFLRAPFSGVIANIEKTQGDFISSAKPFCTIFNSEVFEVFFSILESEYSFIGLNQQVSVESFNDKDQQFIGKITEINPMVDKNGLIGIKAKIVSKKNKLLDGMNVKVFVEKSMDNVVVIPKSAVVKRSNKDVVFTFEDDLAKWNYVDIVAENFSEYAISKGLSLNDTIIISGNNNLSHDKKVSLIQD